MKVTKITKALLSRKRIEKSFPSLGSYSKSDISREAMVLRRSFGKDMEKGLYRSPPIISMKGELANVAGRKKEIKVFQSKVKKIQSAVASRVRSKQKQFGSKARLFEKKLFQYLLHLKLQQVKHIILILKNHLLKMFLKEHHLEN